MERKKERNERKAEKKRKETNARATAGTGRKATREKTDMKRMVKVGNLEV